MDGIKFGYDKSYLLGELYYGKINQYNSAHTLLFEAQIHWIEMDETSIQHESIRIDAKAMSIRWYLQSGNIFLCKNLLWNSETKQICILIHSPYCLNLANHNFHRFMKDIWYR